MGLRSEHRGTGVLCVCGADRFVEHAAASAVSGQDLLFDVKDAHSAFFFSFFLTPPSMIYFP